MQRVKVKNLFKHKIPFYSLTEEYIIKFNTKSILLNIAYKTNTIKHPIELGINNLKDLLDKVNPFIYYLASKYQNIIEWDYEYRIFFDIVVVFPEEEYGISLSNHRLSEYFNDLSIDNTKQNLYEFIKEDIEELISTPFHITIWVSAEYMNRLYEDEDDEDEDDEDEEDESEDESEDEPEEEDEEEKEPIKLKKNNYIR